ncbi:LysR substrate-binding domain-containing protein [Oharaeibacter diazotrophicus]|uniref:LysR family transcriptional regulator n=1 Tax=Oharaeibacter diazotrophicus TaxID=1920512 RepID=A0A4R6R9S6_9HYPH|nr:LysR substrate-binding domain-containing protein [Oharaeibacter diazotrophicus]TDP82367.1 LysR family transcriptional regulator [Oharaeibacter diazotrophicus]BBE72870.1 HTH-type transcriptional regulator YjiE [Pleomorphomonas sp. SM30]GLS76908.1 LysR family transcriptional regulator [Oharaeibacter diazotrophicus]
MEIKWLEDFVSLANTRSFSKSAVERHVTQSAFSRRIQQLEQWLGVPLVDRSTYPTTLTAEGRRFRETAEEVLRLIYVERSQLRSGRAQGQGAITISTLHTLSISFFPGWLKRVEEGFGPINARLITDNFHDSIRVFAEGDCDFLLTYEHPRIPVLLDPERFPSLDLGGDRMIPVSAPLDDGRPRHQLPGAKDRPVPFLAYAPETFLGKLVSVMVAEQGDGLNLAHIYENPMAEALKVMAMTGRGVAWLPESAVKTELAAGTLTVVGAAATIDMRIKIYRSMEKVRPTVERLWKYLRERTPVAAVA